MQQPLKMMMAFASVTGFLVFPFGLQAFVQPAQENRLPGEAILRFALAILPSAVIATLTKRNGKSGVIPYLTARRL